MEVVPKLTASIYNVQECPGGIDIYNWIYDCEEFSANSGYLCLSKKDLSEYFNSLGEDLEDYPFLKVFADWINNLQEEDCYFIFLEDKMSETRKIWNTIRF